MLIYSTKETELTVHVLQDVETGSESPVTAMVSEDGGSKVTLVSFADGAVKVFDRRLEEEDALVRSFDAHTAWVQNVKLHPSLSGQFLTAEVLSKGE